MTALPEPEQSAAFAVTEPSTLWVGGRPIRWAQITHEDLPPESPPFAIRRARIPFENGWAVSLAWGSCTYSSNHDHGIGDTELTETPHDNIFGDDVHAYLGPDQVLAIIDDVGAWPT
jgi:hypothetical protein